MQKKFLLGAIIPLLVLIAPTAMADSSSDIGNAAGQNAARADWQQQNGFHPGCTDHGIDPTNNENFCGGFKAGYLKEWAVLTVVQ